MKVWQALYNLNPLETSSRHIATKGVLLRFQDKERERFSLYHPIESLGDVPLTTFLNEFESLVLKQDKLNSVLKRSLSFDEDEEVLKGKMVECYASVPNLSYFKKNKERLHSLGYKEVKLKVSSVRELNGYKEAVLSSDFKFIFDFSGRGRELEFQNLNKDILIKTSYIEDPVDQNSFSSDLFKVGTDFIKYKEASYHILKPTGFCHDLNVGNFEKTVVTSYLDHPLGQLLAAKFTIEKNVQNLCGLKSHVYFEKNEYSELLGEESLFTFSNLEEFKSKLELENWKKLI